MGNDRRATRGPGVFALAFFESQVQANASALVVGGNYTVTIQLQTRAYGSGGPFTNYSIFTITFTASATTYTSAWYDIPLVLGQQIIATNSGIVRNS